MQIKLKHLSYLYDSNQVILFESKLYERLIKRATDKKLKPPRHKYRVILAYDDYDYVCDRNLKRRLDRAFAKQDKYDAQAK